MAKSICASWLSVLVLAIVVGETTLAAQTPRLITSAIDEGKLAAVPHSIHPSARSEFDQGPAPDNLPINRMLLVLKRSAGQQEALDQFLKYLQQPSSPAYHKWLTPQQFGEQFGVSDADIQVITTWLESHGFQVQPASLGRTYLEFSGNAGQVSSTFHTAIHKFTVAGVDHWANAASQQIPAALAAAVAGVSTLHNFVSAPQSSLGAKGITPQFTSSGSNYLAPGDFATIYNVTPLYPTITGAGITIGVVARTNINVGDISSFRSLFGLPANPPNIIVNGPNPGDLGGSEEAEAVLDTSWSGALATAATIDLVVSETTATTDGADLSEAYIIDNNLANVMTESFGSCEASFSAAQEAMIASLAQQAAAQGITYTVSAGDAGSADCDNFNTETMATGPISVNGLASTPYTLAVGGTQFNENGAASLYWSPSNSATYSSALSYIPEDVWNANCIGSTCGTGSILAGGGGASVYFAKPSWQTGVAGIPADGARDLPDLAFTAAGHDAYLLCLDGSCTAASPSFDLIYGTSAPTPAFAGIVALLNQKVGSRLGQITPGLYALAAAETLSSCNASNTSALPASTCIFNDVTIGTNAVPGEANYNTSSETYPAGVGYDLASGLGSLNVANLVNNWRSSFGIPIASVSPTSLTFASQNDGITSPAQTVTVTNNGSVSLSIASVAFSGADPADFANANGCGSSVAANSSCSISVTFTPLAAGTRTANMVITDNTGDVAGYTQTIALMGTGVAASSGATATFSGTDATTQGTWTGHYGADGQSIASGIQSIPSYATLSVIGDATYTWAPSTTDPRALQTSAGSSLRSATTYYAPSVFTFDLNLTDGNSHQISLYLLDWDSTVRTESISILDAVSGTVLNTEAFSSYNGGVYAIWTIKGHVHIQLTRTGGPNSVVSAVFFGGAGSTTTPTSSATYTGTDTTTQGTWTGHYGGDGAIIANGLQSAPAYATFTVTGDATYTWSPSTADPRALQLSAGSAARSATTYYSATGFTIDLNLTDGNSHQVALYLLDWDSNARAEAISILDAATGVSLDNESYSSFNGGVYAVWTLKGHVHIQVTLTGGVNAVVSALFFGPGGSTTTPTSTATYSGSDTATQGTWTGHYGADGLWIANGLKSIPAYATIGITGEATYTWAASTTDPRALQTSKGSSLRSATTFYSPSSFTIDLNLTDGNAHKVSLYLCDWDSNGRAETISVVDAATGIVLNSQSFSGFVSGVWAPWVIKGHVQIQVSLASGTNAVDSGIFFN